ncbi:MAG: tetratricopeptide repeat protein [Pseudomonadota bacterium]
MRGVLGKSLFLSLLFVMGLPVSGIAENHSNADAKKDTPALIEPADEKEDAPTPAEPVPSRFGEHPVDEAYGAFQRGLYLTARNLAKPRAEDGDPAAQALLAEIYARGLGVPRDVETAAFWYEKAAEQGVPEAQFQFALLLLKRSSKGEAEYEQATALMKTAADSGNAQAQFNYAQLLLAQQPGSSGQVNAFEYFKAAAEKDIADAQYALSQYYLSGNGNVVPDVKEARRWLEKAASQNFDTAQFELGNMLLSGVGGSRDLESGFGLIKGAAISGNVSAQIAVAKLYWGGIGVEPDSVEAAAWLILARRAGLNDAVLEDFWEGLSAETQQAALIRANRLR